MQSKTNWLTFSRAPSAVGIGSCAIFATTKSIKTLKQAKEYFVDKRQEYYPSELFNEDVIIDWWKSVIDLCKELTDYYYTSDDLVVEYPQCFKFSSENVVFEDTECIDKDCMESRKPKAIYYNGSWYYKH